MKPLLTHIYRFRQRLPLAIGLCMLLFTAAFAQNHAAMAATADDTAYIRVIHASPDIGTVDVFVDGKKFLSNFKFATVTDYVPLPAGTHKVQLALIGKGINAAVLSQDLTIQDGTPYTVAALGTKESGFSFSVFADDNTISGNETKVRVYHLSPGTADASITTPTSTIVNDIAYNNASTYVPMASGTYKFTLTAATGNTTLSANITLKPWTVMSIFAVGVPQGSPQFQLVTTQQQGIPGLPQTGSDPNAPVVAATPSYWLLALSAFCILALGGSATYAMISRGTTKKRASNPLAPDTAEEG
jgi:hypothetical protein